MRSSFRVEPDLMTALLSPLGGRQNGLKRILAVNVSDYMDAQLVVASHPPKVGLYLFVVRRYS
jgi:hypothetical protein